LTGPTSLNTISRTVSRFPLPGVTTLFMKAIAYCRVSSKEQVEGTSLSSQVSAAEEYARANNLSLVKVFIEEGESAKFADRTKLLELLDYCEQNRGGVDLLLVWKLDRLARNAADHFNIKAALAKYSVRLVSITEPIDPNPEGELMETILAGFAQFDNEIRATRSVHGMRRKIQEGIFPWKPPFGYKGKGRSLKKERKTQPDEPDQPVFGLLQKAWQQYATGAFSKSDILRLLAAWGVTTRRGVPVRGTMLDNIFINPFYAGIIIDPWTNREYEGLHVPMVSREQFAQVQEVLRGRNRSVSHLKFRAEFPLRGIARCPSCYVRLSGTFCRGRTRRYPYYYCLQPGCSKRKKAIPVKRVNDEFEAFLLGLTVNPPAVDRLIHHLEDRKTKREAEVDAQRSRFQMIVDRVNRQLTELLRLRTDNMITDTEFQNERASLLLQRDASSAKLHKLTKSTTTTEDPGRVRSTMTAFCSPLQLWNKTSTRLGLRFRFASAILPTGFVAGEIRTAEIACTFRIVRVFSDEDPSEVRPIIPR